MAQLYTLLASNAFSSVQSFPVPLLLCPSSNQLERCKVLVKRDTALAAFTESSAKSRGESRVEQVVRK